MLRKRIDLYMYKQQHTLYTRHHTIIIQ